MYSEDGRVKPVYAQGILNKEVTSMNSMKYENFFFFFWLWNGVKTENCQISLTTTFHHFFVVAQLEERK